MNLHKWCDIVIIVDAPYDVRLNRVKLRDNRSEKEFELFNSMQYSIESKLSIVKNPIVFENTSFFPMLPEILCFNFLSEICSLSIVFIIVVEIIGLICIPKLNIPLESVPAAYWVLQFSIFAAAVTIMTVPYDALIIANEKFDALESFSKLLFLSLNELTSPSLNVT